MKKEEQKQHFQEKETMETKSPEQESQENPIPEHNFEEEIQLLKDQLLRALAEVDNTQKRAMREREEAQKYSISNFARDLLIISDTLEKAIESIPSEERVQEGLLKTICEGISFTKEELSKVFSKHKIKVINPIGEKFDHNYHQAVLEIDSKDHPAGTIVQVFQVGYVLQDRLLRPAMVSVSKSKTN